VKKSCRSWKNSIESRSPNVEDSQPCDVGTALTVWRGERIVTSTPQAAPALVHPSPLSEVDSPVQGRPLLPKRVLELRGSRSFMPQRTILQSSLRQSRPHGDATTSTISSSSYSVEKGLSDSLQFVLDSEVSGGRLESVGEVDQSTLVEADSVYSRKVDAGIQAACGDRG
jgi:hypothetical protein